MVDKTKTFLLEQQETRETKMDLFFVLWENQEGSKEEGPLEVLWELIESYKVDIFDVSLRKITDDFIQFLKKAEELNVEPASSFICMAARLILYKSRALLPNLSIEEADEEPRLPPELVQQFLEYRKYQLAAERLHEIEQISSGMFIRKNTLMYSRPQQHEQVIELPDLSLSDLLQSYSRLLHSIDEKEKKFQGLFIELEHYTVEDQLVRIRSFLTEENSFCMEEILNRHYEPSYEQRKTRHIIIFLAILELCRNREVLLQQKEAFAPIFIVKRKLLSVS